MSECFFSFANLNLTLQWRFTGVGRCILPWQWTPYHYWPKKTKTYILIYTFTKILFPNTASREWPPVKNWRLTDDWFQCMALKLYWSRHKISSKNPVNDLAELWPGFKSLMPMATGQSKRWHWCDSVQFLDFRLVPFPALPLGCCWLVVSFVILML